MKKRILAVVIGYLVVHLIACTGAGGENGHSIESISVLDSLISGSDSIVIDKTIYETAFMGISPGDSITSITLPIKKDIMSDGEGDFQVYRIKNGDSGAFGYFMADPKNEKLVGDITITSPKVATEKEVFVGDTYETLIQKYGKMDVHGSEIEGRTYASNGSLKFRLDAVNNTYDIDESKIRKATKITEIVIGR